MRTSSAYTLIELLIVILILGIILAIGWPVLFKARENAHDANAKAYAGQVYKVAYAHVAEKATNPFVSSNDCKGGYTAGIFSTSPNKAIDTCTVTDAGDKSPVVTVKSLAGNVFTLP